MRHYPGALLDLLADILQATPNELIEFEAAPGRKEAQAWRDSCRGYAE
jgi:hypothetical protein